MHEIKEAALYMIEYIDLAQHTDFATQDFFTDETYSLSKLTVVGWALECEVNGGINVVKVVWCNDDDGQENSEGMVIPISCILRKVRLEPNEYDDSLDDIIDTEKN